MFAGLDRQSRLPDLQDQLRRAHDVTPDLMSKVVAGAGTRFTMPSCAGKAARIDRLIESEAWTEAALALVEVECRNGGCTVRFTSRMPGSDCSTSSGTCGFGCLQTSQTLRHSTRTTEFFDWPSREVSG
jgi:hypothetical protein